MSLQNIALALIEHYIIPCGPIVGEVHDIESVIRHLGRLMTICSIVEVPLWRYTNGDNAPVHYALLLSVSGEAVLVSWGPKGWETFSFTGKSEGTFLVNRVTPEVRGSMKVVKRLGIALPAKKFAEVLNKINIEVGGMYELRYENCHKVSDALGHIFDGMLILSDLPYQAKRVKIQGVIPVVRCVVADTVKHSVSCKAVQVRDAVTTRVTAGRHAAGSALKTTGNFGRTVALGTQRKVNALWTKVGRPFGFCREDKTPDVPDDEPIEKGPMRTPRRSARHARASVP